MKNKMISFLSLSICFLFFCTSCANLKKLNREPNSDPSFESLYLDKLRTDLLDEHVSYLTAVHQRKLKVKNTEYDLNFNDPIEDELSASSKELAQLTQKLRFGQNDVTEVKTNSNKLQFSVFKKNWRKAHQTFLLHNINLYETQRTRTYHLSEADEVEVSLNNYFYSWEHNFGAIDKDNSTSGVDGRANKQRYLLALFTCEGPYKFDTDPKAAGITEKFMWYDQFSNGQHLTVNLNRQSKNCELRFKNPENNKVGSVKFISNTNSVIDQVSSRFESCIQFDTTKLSGPEKFFYGADNSRLTCPVAVSKYEHLPTPRQTMESKLKALIGQNVPTDFWAAKTPFYAFDMTDAPHFDAIFISYLVFRNDFFGRTVAELLKWHARRGTEVYIMNSKVISVTKDSQMFLDMMAEYPNVHVQEYAYTTRSGLGLKDMFDQLHRTLHSKLFITYSKNNLALNRAWVGGRNIHDGFAFEKMPQSTTNDIVDYAKDDSWAFWRDFESIISDHYFVDQLISQFATLWNRDSETLFVRDSVMNLKSDKQILPSEINLKTPMARHILTIPYNDKMNLENFMSALINSAEKEIIFSTPYFRPTQKLADAFINAIQRGVKVKMITRIDLKGDTLDWLLSDVNKAGVNQFLNKIEMYEYTAPNEILHSKIFLIDGKLTFFGGVNLNKRSFYHDIENGVLTLGTELNSEMKALFDTYFIKSKLISEKMKTAYWKQALIHLFDKEF